MARHPVDEALHGCYMPSILPKIIYIVVEFVKVLLKFKHVGILIILNFKSVHLNCIV